MLEAFFDESGIHQGAKVCVIAGYFGHSVQWRVFADKWLRVLQDFSFPLRDFHATDLIEKRDHQPMLEALAQTIATSEIYPISSGIIVDDFFSFTEEQRKFFTGATIMPNWKLKNSGSPNKPYFVPFQRVLENVTSYTTRSRVANFSFGIDRPMEKYAKPFFGQIKKSAWTGFGWKTRDRLGAPLFPLAKETPQLQAADLLSLLTYRHMEERHAANDWEVMPKGLLETCLRKMRSRNDHGYETRDSLQIPLDQSYAILGNWDGHQP
jgi:hypothetical protein